VIIVGGSFEVDPGQRDEFIAGRHDAMRTSRAEAGCLDYTISADPIDAARVVLYERWESQDALDAHLAGMRTNPPPSGGGAVPVSVSVKVYDIAGERSMGG
jgi:quinol monooxygenase YgiN